MRSMMMMLMMMMMMMMMLLLLLMMRECVRGEIQIANLNDNNNNDDDNDDDNNNNNDDDGDDGDVVDDGTDRGYLLRTGFMWKEGMGNSLLHLKPWIILSMASRRSFIMQPVSHIHVHDSVLLHRVFSEAPDQTVRTMAGRTIKKMRTTGGSSTCNISRLGDRPELFNRLLDRICADLSVVEYDASKLSVAEIKSHFRSDLNSSDRTEFTKIIDQLFDKVKCRKVVTHRPLHQHYADDYLLRHSDCVQKWVEKRMIDYFRESSTSSNHSFYYNKFNELLARKRKYDAKHEKSPKDRVYNVGIHIRYGDTAEQPVQVLAVYKKLKKEKFLLDDRSIPLSFIQKLLDKFRVFGIRNLRFFVFMESANQTILNSLSFPKNAIHGGSRSSMGFFSYLFSQPDDETQTFTNDYTALIDQVARHRGRPRRPQKGFILVDTSNDLFDLMFFSLMMDVRIHGGSSFPYLASLIQPDRAIITDTWYYPETTQFLYHYQHQIINSVYWRSWLFRKRFCASPSRMRSLLVVPKSRSDRVQIPPDMYH
jgi:hypothetical protein